MHTRLETDCGTNSKCIQIVLRNFFKELDTTLDKCVVFRIVPYRVSQMLYILTI
jgi:hypothetical protein